MDTSTAFLEAICLEPDDDGLRLIYADWLDDHGDPDRGAFIRVQCELASTEPGDGNPDDIGRLWESSCRWHSLRRRERELLDEHGGRWKFTTFVSVCVAAHPGDEKAGLALLHCLCEGATFRRGFVESVTLTCAAFAGGPCGRCRGAGRGRDPDFVHDRPRPLVSCPDCHGTGRTEGVAGALFRAAPVTSVVLSDRRPERHQSRHADPAWAWNWVFGDEPAALPEALFDLLPGGWPALMSGRRLAYPTEQAATDALSIACVALGRRAAGLPALTPARAAAP